MLEIEQQSKETERLVLGEMLLEPGTAKHYVNRLREDYFTDDDLKPIFRAVRETVNAGKTPDLLVVQDWILKHRSNTNAEDVGQITARMVDLTMNVYSSVNIEEHINLLREAYVRRKIHVLAIEMQNDTLDFSVPADSLPEKILKRLQELQEERPWEQVFQSQPEVAESALKEREETVNRKDADGVTGIPTGIGTLDRRTGGWQPDEFIVVGGMNGEGKTWFMVWFMLQAALHGDACLAFSLEMTNEELYARELLAKTSLTAHEFYHEQLTPQQLLEVDVVRQKLDSLPITYMDENEYDVDKLCVMARELHGKGQCQMLFVDYAQIIPASERYFERRVDAVAYITRKLKNLAKELHIPVLALAQLNREGERNNDSKPRKSDLRESASLEHDADRIYLIWRPELHGLTEIPIRGKHVDTEHLIEFIEAKNRKFGGITYHLRVNKAFTQIAEEWQN